MYTKNENIIVGQTIIHGFICTACEDTFYEVPSWGYCDRYIECTDPDTLVAHEWVADEADAYWFPIQ